MKGKCEMKNLSIGKASDVRKLKKKFRKTFDAVCDKSKELIDDSARAVRKATKKLAAKAPCTKKKCVVNTDVLLRASLILAGAAIGNAVYMFYKKK